MNKQQVRTRFKWILVSLLVCLAGGVLYYRYTWTQNRDTILKLADDRLTMAANLMPLVLPKDFHDRAVGPDSISVEEQLLNKERLNGFVALQGLRYAQTLVRHNGKFHFSAFAAGEKGGQGAWYFKPYEAYKNARESLDQAYQTGQEVFLSYGDQWGDYRALCKRFFSPQGVPYLVLVDVQTGFIERLMIQTASSQLLSVFFILLILSPLGCILVVLSLNLRDANAKLKTANDSLSKQIHLQRNWLLDVESKFRKGQDRLEQVHELQQNSLAGLLTFDDAGRITEINQMARDILGIPSDWRTELVLSELGSPFFWGRLSRRIQDAEVRGKEVFSEEIRVHKLDGTPLTLLVRVHAASRDGGEILLYHASFVDISELKSNQDQLNYMESHDVTSGLLNRGGLRQALLDKEELYGRSPSVFVLSIRDFKRINAALGADAGDAVLMELTRRLKDTLKSGEELARLGGMEFGLASFEAVTREESEVVAQRLLDTLQAPFLLGNITDRKITLSGHVGVRMASESGTIDEMISSAMLAAAESKRREHNRVLFFSDRLKTRSVESIEMENALREAIQSEDFTIVFQPIVEIKTRRTRGVEALVRWFGADRKPISPEEFIPMAEKTGMMPALSEALFKLTARSFLQLRKAVPGIYLSLNVSTVLFRDNLVELMLKDIVEGQGVLPSEVLLEITETALIEDMKDCRDTLVRLNEKGYTIAIDDFGAGNSSISYLQNFPIHKLKIDKSFVQQIGSQDKDWTLIRAILRMSEVLQVVVVAEGVETEGQERLLRELGCPLGQGYLYYRPMDLETCMKNLAAEVPNV